MHMGNLSADFQSHIDHHFPELMEGKSVLAVSGGIDSMVLCELLFRSRATFSVAHCNFQLRGSESFDDEQFVIKRCKDLRLEIHVKRFDTRQYADEKRLSIQMAARELRYTWFNKILDQTGSAFLITAHHADDNLETFLINLSRGTGINGLTGIPERTGNIVRPLLPFSREEILNFAKSSGIEWREDHSNSENEYLRNQIRNQLVPVMKETFPSLLYSFNKTMSHLKETRSIAEDRLREAWLNVCETKGHVTCIDISKVQSLGNPRAYLYGMLNDFGFTQWEDIEELLSAQSGKMIFSDTHRLLKDREHLMLQKTETLPDKDLDFLILEDGDSYPIGLKELRIKRFSVKENGRTIIQSCKERNLACLDADRLIFPLRVRKWQKGDYFYPIGMNGSKKLSKFFKDEKLSVPEKENIWLLCSGKEVVWVIGLRIDERFKVTEKTENVLRLELIK